jgi:hypothetical protein
MDRVRREKRVGVPAAPWDFSHTGCHRPWDVMVYCAAERTPATHRGTTRSNGARTRGPASARCHTAGLPRPDRTIALRGESTQLGGGERGTNVSAGADVNGARKVGSQPQDAVTQFLVEAELVQRVEETAPIINLSSASLSGADLRFADLRGADLSDARVSNEQLDQADSLEGATMPDGSKHP